MIEFVSVDKHYPMGQRIYPALQDINLHIAAGEKTAIMGPSGSGKTTTMNIIGLLDRPTSGQYFLAGEDTAHFSGDALARLRNRTIGFVFQSFYLLPKLSALQNVALPLHYAGEAFESAKLRSMAMLEKVGMQDYAAHRPMELSGGQQQRVALARALIVAPKVILADEPTGALDSKTSDLVMRLLLDVAQETTVVVITHDAGVAKQCQRTVRIEDGRILES